MVQALVAGNAVLLKPGAGCSKAARSLVELVEASGLPADLVAVLDEAPEAGQWAMDAGVELIVDSALSLDHDPYLADHRVDGVCVLPGVMMLEAMAQAAADTQKT